MARELVPEQFDAQIASGLVLVDFYGDHCPACRMLVPILDQLAVEVADRAVIAKLNASKAMELASRFAITAIPALVLFKDGQEVKRLIGFQRVEKLRQLIDSVV